MTVNAIGAAALFIAFLFAAAAGGGGRAVFAICVGAAVFAGLNIEHLRRLTPIRQVITIVLAGMMILLAAAFTIDLE